MRRNFVQNSRWLWPDGKVPYEIATGAFSAEQEAIIYKAVAEMKAKTCVNFTPRGIADVTHNDYIYFDNIQGSGCWSYVGKISVGKQDIGLDSSQYCLNNPTVLHEMCHAIGMEHEQSRMDRDKYVTMLWDNIKNGRDNANMKKWDTEDVNPYDYESILQYYLTDFAKSAGTYSMRFNDTALEVLAGSADELTFYDVKDITDAYGCTENCGTDIPTCENGGFIDHSCSCLCPATLSGDDCSQVPTDTGCGGIIDVTSGPQTITSPNYPENYDVGATCNWLVKGPPGKLIELTINDLNLSYNDVNMNCYHWLEIRYNLIGQTGLMKCGEVTNEVYTTTWFEQGITNILYMQFNTTYADDKSSSKGFSLNVQAVKIGCASSPCIHGSCLDDPTEEFKCICDDLYEGDQCEKIKASSAFSCDFENADECVFVNNDDGVDVFDWTRKQGRTPSVDTGPSQAFGGQYYTYAEVSFLNEGDTAVLLSNGVLPVGEWCMSFMYHMYGDSLGKFEIFGEKDQQVWWSNSANLGDQWNYASIKLPLEIDQKIGLRATVGWHFWGDIAIDDLHLQKCVQERCDFETGNECFLSQSYMDDFDWKVDQIGETPSSNTGPSSAQDGTHYAFIESSDPIRYDMATLTSLATFPAGEYCLVFFYHMYGKKMGGLLVSTLEDSSGEEYPVFIKTGDQGQQWNQGVVSLHERTYFNLLFSAIRGTSYSSDVAIDNISLTSERCACLSSPCLNGGTCVPDVSVREGYQCTCPSGLSGGICEVVAADKELTCTFENDAVCFLQQAWGDSFDWTITGGSTATPHTGPSGAEEGTYYAYIETSGVVTEGFVANFTTYPMAFEEGVRCLRFSYHMYGLTIGQLSVYNGDTRIFYADGNKENQWNDAKVDVVNLPVSSQLIISASVDQDHEYGDIAIDDVSLTPGSC
ncbi:MAM and LDL-receptor class A domain-containing protein 1-like [Pecten maximus]|uniref:MAM and LDL-receptor class A domain-containing protein 1-like n=1 Tax=Pecten maximus TaxID=6579 RepID=UPI001458C6C8|nr:MAM and LDL-receptor class A domain-containing protein 1-like [Pecten maximus]